MNERKYKVFISSVQNEFESERAALEQFFSSDVLLQLFFETFLFERISATSQPPESVFLGEVHKADLYIGLLGKKYGFEGKDGVSPTEKEYEAARKKEIPRWIYILKTPEKRDEKEERLIEKVSSEVSWKFFSDIESLRKEVYHTCIEFLKQKGKIENSDFDSSLHPYATFDDISDNLLQEFIVLAREKRNFAEKPNALKADVLKRLNLTRNGKVVNSALLLFSANPQQFFPSATVKCAHFHGTQVQKPIPDYKEFGGTVWDMADSAVDFILSKINVSTGTRDHSNLVETQYEIPRAALAEAVINAIAHRDYYSKGSVQISVFTDRIEIENPGRLPDEITVEDLKKVHSSYPHNSLLANCLFLTGAIERFGTGTNEMVDKISERGLAEPVFVSRNSFKVVLWRKLFAYGLKNKVRVQDREQDGIQDREQVAEQILQLIRQIQGEMTASELMDLLSLKGRRNFTEYYLQPSIMQGYIEMSDPDKPTIKTQTYRLTTDGLKLKEAMKAAPPTQETSLATEQVTDQVAEQVTEQVIEQVTEQVSRLIMQLDDEMSIKEILNVLGLKHRPTLIYDYLNPSLNSGLAEMTQPHSPKSPTQKYRLTPKGKLLQQQLRKKPHVRHPDQKKN